VIAELGGRLAALAARHGLPSDAAERLERLLLALAREADPPTTVRDPGRAIDLHIADSLAALELDVVRAAGLVADLGAGAGFPGLPLAIALACARVELVESARRKCGVIDRLAEAAGVANARTVTARAEELASHAGRERYDLVTARALARLPVVVEYAAPLLAPGGALVVWRGARDEREERAGDAAAEEVGLSTGTVLRAEPFAGAHSRHLELFTKSAPTPDRFPRRAGIAAKRPLA